MWVEEKEMGEADEFQISSVLRVTFWRCIGASSCISRGTPVESSFLQAPSKLIRGIPLVICTVQLKQDVGLVYFICN
jgi:hypothetical protein